MRAGVGVIRHWTASVFPILAGQLGQDVAAPALSEIKPCEIWQASPALEA